ncbi:MAG: apolipoprotein N-acyltransferase [Psychrobacter sp.]|uniref:apolipoprotein N-acyltransferase n=1 Tax=Psychrobacter sp. TaxID=56811 RepID=UPI00264821DA|nr:apolipoprotein N-acyltransferase [Psychrobacter sp.]MDN6275071.1 apolipoprotein N-acyltransferase [Psychrobacter sp.]MDN6307168.1 apolipoprotein N-acyltransferase [Psychrobacter sp.]
MRLSSVDLQKRLNPDKPKGMPMLMTLLIALLAGAVFLFALAPYGIWPLALLSPAILYALLMPQMSGKRAFLIGQAYGTGLWCVGAFWLYTSIHVYGATPAWLALIMIALMGLGMGLFHGFLALIFNRMVGKQPLSFAALWILQEWMKTWLFTGFPWLFVGYAFTEQYWLSSLAPVAGVFAISFVAVLLAASVVELLRRRGGYMVVPIVLLVISTSLWLINPQWTKEKGTPDLSVSLIQGNIPQDLKWLTEYQVETLNIYAQLTSTEWGRDIILWPESSIPMFQTDAVGFINEMVKMAKETDTTWVTGIPYKDDAAFDETRDEYPPFYNSVIALGADAEGLYKKQRLVPFGEYIPLEGLLDILPDLAGSQDIMSYSRGSDTQSPLRVRGHNLGAAVCYEVAYPDTTRRNAVDTDFLLTISNDAWFGKSAGPLQHLQMVQMRALENGRWFMRATNTGVTAIIDHKGHIVERAPQFERMVLRGDIQAREGQTPFTRFGNYPILFTIALLLLLSYLGRRSRTRVKLGRS